MKKDISNTKKKAKVCTISLAPHPSGIEPKIELTLTKNKKPMPQPLKDIISILARIAAEQVLEEAENSQKEG